MTKQDLFESITELVGGNKRSAIQILLFIDDYLIDHLEGYCADDCTVDFGAIAAEQIDLMEEVFTTPIVPDETIEWMKGFKDD